MAVLSEKCPHWRCNALLPTFQCLQERLLNDLSNSNVSHLLILAGKISCCTNKIYCIVFLPQDPKTAAYTEIRKSGTQGPILQTGWTGMCIRAGSRIQQLLSANRSHVIMASLLFMCGTDADINTSHSDVTAEINFL